MSETVEIQVICDFDPVEIQVFEAGDVEGVTVHEQLTGRDADDQHPTESITPPANTLGAAPADTAILPIFTTAWLRLTWGNLKAWLKTYFDTLYGAKQIQFFPTEQIAAFTITADMIGKLVYINSATDVNVSVDNMEVGGTVRFHLLGAGLPIFLEGVNQSITGIDEDGKPLGTDRTDILIERFENDGTTEIYNVI